MDMTSSEVELAATVKRQLLDQRRPATPEEEALVRQEAAEVAAEMIQAERAELFAGEDSDEGLPESEYHAFLRETIERERAMLDEEAAEIEADRLR